MCVCVSCVWEREREIVRYGLFFAYLSTSQLSLKNDRLMPLYYILFKTYISICIQNRNRKRFYTSKEIGGFCKVNADYAV